MLRRYILMGSRIGKTVEKWKQFKIKELRTPDYIYLHRERQKTGEEENEAVT